MKRIKYKNPNKKLLILDIDETLIYLDNKYCFEITTDNEPDFIYADKYYAIKRPYLDQFLREVSKKYDIALWTAGSEQYANDISKVLKLKTKFNFSKNEMSNGQKSLTIVINHFPEFSKKDIIVIDDKEEYYLNDLENLILIKPFFGNQNDEELIRVFKLL